MTAYRLFKMINLLIAKGNLPASYLAGQFEVSVRTIYRDVETLSQAGIPVYTQPGRNGGIRLLDTYVLNKSLLTEEDQQQIMLALQNIHTVHLPVDDLLLKLSNLFRKPINNWIEVDLLQWGSSEEDKHKFDTLRTAIYSKNMLSFEYLASTGTRTKRIVKPAKLVFKNRYWYLQAFCIQRNDYRTFKILRMAGLTILSEKFDDELDPPPLDYDYQTANTIRLVLEFPESAAHRIADEFHPSQITFNNEGKTTVTLDWPYDHWMIGFLLSFGSHVRIISPDFVREVVKKEAEKILKSD